MKNLLITLLALTLCIGLVACGNNAEVEDTTAAVTENVESADAAIIAPDVDKTTIGGIHWDAFVSAIEADANATVDDLAGAALYVEVDGAPLNQFMGGVMPIEAGAEYFPGFDNYVVTGYKAAANFMPMMGSIAYVGYVFELEEGADVQGFINNLTDNCNPRWNICVSADQTVVGAVGNKVFFLMCPETYEMPEEAFGDMGGMAL